MRILVHDNSGHAFTVQLSRALAARGHQVLHLFSQGFNAPRGNLVRQPGDAETFEVEGLSLGEPIAKYDYLKRRRQETRYAGLLEARVTEFAPDIVLAGNTPLDILTALARACRRLSTPWVFWLQDIYSEAVRAYAVRKHPILGSLAGKYYHWKEGQLLRDAAEIVAISDGFAPIVERIAGPSAKVTVIENWAPLADIPAGERENPWATAQGLDGKTTLIYSGTLGLKHNPQLLVDLADHLRDRPEVRILVISEGPGADFLREKQVAGGLVNLTVLPWQPFEDLPNVLASADVLLAVLEPAAGVLSVPSKVLANMCGGRPQLLAVPPENLASIMLLREEAGIAVAPDDVQAWLEAADRLLGDAALRRRLGENARAYAERAFDIEPIADRFETVFAACRPDWQSP